MVCKTKAYALAGIVTLTRHQLRKEHAMRYYQCRLSEVGGTGRTVGWIEERGAKVNALVELKEFGGALYRVDDVFRPGLEASVLAEKQARDRNSLPSLQTA